MKSLPYVIDLDTGLWPASGRLACDESSIYDISYTYNQTVCYILVLVASLSVDIICFAWGSDGHIP